MSNSADLLSSHEDYDPRDYRAHWPRKKKAEHAPEPVELPRPVGINDIELTALSDADLEFLSSGISTELERRAREARAREAVFVKDLQDLLEEIYKQPQPERIVRAAAQGLDLNATWDESRGSSSVTISRPS